MDRCEDRGKLVSREEIIACFHDGMTIGIGGQAGCNSPWRLIECIIESGARHLTVFSIDTGDPDKGVGRLVHEGRIDHLVTTHVGSNPETSRKMLAGEIEVELAPMGSFMERLRCSGAGLGGVLTKTGLGTIVQEGKQVITVNGEQYLLEEPLYPEISITRCRRADVLGNLAYRGTGTASHPIVAMAGRLSIVECDHLCDVGEIAPDEVRVPAIYTDMILA